MLNRKLAAVFLAVCTLSVSAVRVHAQDRYMEIAVRHSRAEIFHNVLVLPDGDSVSTVVTFRIPNSLLVFKQERDGFSTDVEVTVELLRSGKKVADRIWRDKHYASTFAATQSRTDDVDGWIYFRIKPGVYTYRLIVHGLAMDERGVRRTFDVADRSDRAIGPLVFGSLQRDSLGVSLDPTALGGNVPFGKDVPAIVPLPGKILMRDSGGSADSGVPGQVVEGFSAETVLNYQLYRVAPTGRDAITRGNRRQRRADYTVSPEPVEISGRDVRVATGSVTAAELVPAGTFLGSNRECLCWSPPAADTNYFAVVALGTDRLENGTYILNVTPSKGGPSQKFMFSTQWRDMPLSLYDVEIAIRHLEFIEDRETIRAMLKGSNEMRMEAFKLYWNERDPTPQTVLNELMYEYYRRIDDAALEFRTGQHPYPDGLRTDAAHIYVVHGPPDDIASALPPSGGVEQTWTYADGRRFIFRASSSFDPLELQERAVP